MTQMNLWTTMSGQIMMINFIFKKFVAIFQKMIEKNLKPIIELNIHKKILKISHQFKNLNKNAKTRRV